MEERAGRKRRKDGNLCSSELIEEPQFAVLDNLPFPIACLQKRYWIFCCAINCNFHAVFPKKKP